MKRVTDTLRALQASWEKQRQQTISDETYYRGAVEAVNVILSTLEKENNEGQEQHSVAPVSKKAKGRKPKS